VNASDEMEVLEAEARYYRDRVALLRAKLYRGAVVPSARLRELERRQERAERRVQEQRMRTAEPNRAARSARAGRIIH
jgi:hypothetical protein